MYLEGKIHEKIQADFGVLNGLSTDGNDPRDSRQDSL